MMIHHTKYMTEFMQARHLVKTIQTAAESCADAAVNDLPFFCSTNKLSHGDSKFWC
jgi:hypothetical protein